jgi:hypothetical protein
MDMAISAAQTGIGCNFIVASTVDCGLMMSQNAWLLLCKLLCQQAVQFGIGVELYPGACVMTWAWLNRSNSSKTRNEPYHLATH